MNKIKTTIFNKIAIIRLLSIIVDDDLKWRETLSILINKQNCQHFGTSSIHLGTFSLLPYSFIKIFNLLTN